MVLATKKNCQRVFAAGLRVVSAMTGNPPLQALKVGWLAQSQKSCHGQALINVQFLTTLPNSKACNSPYMQDYFKQSFVFCFSEVVFLFLIKMLMLKAIEIKNFIFHSLGISKGLTLDYFFYASRMS